ncbi:MAG: hypothetical protein KFW09_04660 [Oscillospiraceae bacterium]|nr:hypothetical protein [Oscillospiraceae bacterium]
MKEFALKFTSSFLAIIIFSVFTFSHINVHAEESPNYSVTNEIEMKISKYVSDIILTKNFDQAKKILEENNISLLSIDNKPKDSIKAISPNDYDILTYSYRINGSSDIYLQSTISSNRDEWFSGPLDVASIEWNTRYANYVSSKSDLRISTVRDISKARNGIVLFNIQDKNLKKGTSTHIYVRVKPVRGGELQFGTKYIHTYSRFHPSISINFTNGQFGLSFNLSINNGGAWQRWNGRSVIVYP